MHLDYASPDYSSPVPNQPTKQQYGQPTDKRKRGGGSDSASNHDTMRITKRLTD
jgi:hypothetical protein